jgi:hypothetical protein
MSSAKKSAELGAWKAVLYVLPAFLLIVLFFYFPLGSGLIDQSQKMTVAAMQMADMKVWAQRS